MEKILKYLNDRGFVETMKHAVSVAPKLFGEELDEKRAIASVRRCLLEVLKEDEKLQDLVFEYSMNLAIDNIVESLDIKFDAEGAEITKDDCLAAMLALIKSL